MRNPSTLLDALQKDWPLATSLTLLGLQPPPPWAADAAISFASSLAPAERAACQTQFPALIDRLAVLYRQWAVAAVLASLLALAIMAQAASVGVLGTLQIAVLMSVLCAVLLPPLLICNGIARDHVAAQALLLAVRGTARATR